MAKHIRVKILRNSIVGVGQIERPTNGPGIGGDATQCGLVIKPKVAKKGEVISIAEPDGNRLISLGSAILAENEQLTKKAA